MSRNIPTDMGELQSREEDDSLWETLEQPAEPPAFVHASSTAATTTTTTAATTTTANSPAREIPRTSSSRAATSQSASNPQPSPSTPSPSSSSTLPPRIQAIQRRLETRSQLKQSLVEHPIQLLWSHFFVHFGRELWALDWNIRFALLLILSGGILKIVILTTWYLWYPRLVFAGILLVIPLIYLHPSMLQDSVEALLVTCSSPPQIADSLSQLEPAQLRKAAVGLLFVPTLLEMRTIHFLSQIKAESGWTLYNLCVAIIILSIMLYLRQVKHCSPRECTQKGLVLLYGSALLVTLIRIDLLRIPILAAPFLLATGVLILASRDDDMEWFSRAIRHALRLTLRDVLSTVSTSVQSNEMLQLAMLRWIVDYWSNSPVDEATRPASQRSEPDSRGVPTETRLVDQTATSQRNVASSLALHRHELQWDELWSMLSMTTDQMESEVDTLQHPVVTERSQQSSTYSNTSGQTNPPSATSAPTSTSKCNSVQNLQSMLSSMDIDERAKPAVMAYKRGVQAFPPSRNTAVVLSVARRCPALLTLLWQIVFGVSANLSSTVILLPFILFEMIRIQAWSEACQRTLASTTATACTLNGSTSEAVTSLSSLDPMMIVFSGDTFSARKPPTLLVVWRNVCDSVSALETGLTAARCVQTTAVAVDFAGNIMSLAQFGFEVSQKGWVHGLVVVMKELLVLHSAAPSNAIRPRGSDAKYTTAAVDAVRNSQKVSRNVRVLMEEEDAGRVLRPLLDFLPALFGQGWIWGRVERKSMSTVAITELEDRDVPPPSTVGDAVVDRVHNSNVRSIALEGTTGRLRTPQESNEPVQQSSLAVIKANESIPRETDTRLLLELSKVMELIAACDERSVLHEDDKISICEKLALFGTDKGPSFEWLEASTRTLQGLLDHIPEEGECALEPSRVQATPELEEIPQDGSPLSENRPDHATPSASPEDRLRVDNYNNSDFEPLQPLERIGDSSYYPHEDAMPSRVNAESRDLNTGTSETTADTTSSARERVGLQSSPSENAEEENLWLKVGGGIAVLGAVVGGVALAAMGQQGNDDSVSGRRRHPTSSVVIEEVEDGDGWVAVPTDRHK